MTEQATHDCTMTSNPTEAHTKLAPFVGTFDAEVKMWMGPGDPVVSTGEMTNTMTLGGRFLQQDYKGHETEGPFPSFEGRGFWGFNTVRNVYEGFWIDTVSTFMQTESGDVDAAGRVWTMTGEMDNPMGPGKLEKKSIVTLIDNDRHSMEMFFKADGKESKGMEIQYTRKR